MSCNRLSSLMSSLIFGESVSLHIFQITVLKLMIDIVSSYMRYILKFKRCHSVFIYYLTTFASFFSAAKIRKKSEKAGGLISL